VSWEHEDALEHQPVQWKGGPQGSFIRYVACRADPIYGRTPPMTLEYIASRCGISRGALLAAAKALSPLIENVTGHKGRLKNVWRARWEPTTSRRNSLGDGSFNDSTVQKDSGNSAGDERFNGTKGSTGTYGEETRAGARPRPLKVANNQPRSSKRTPVSAQMVFAQLTRKGTP